MNTEQPEKNSIPLAEPRLPVHLVDNQTSIENLITALLTNRRSISIDAERASGFRYGQKAYLIQIAIQDVGIYLFDPIGSFEAGSLTKFKEIVSGTPWIIHAASQDLPCLAEFGLQPSKLFDTELAGRLLGFPKVSLGTLTEELLGLSLAKEHSAVDWSSRPLPASWLTYAALDVDVLFDLQLSINQLLIESMKIEFAEQEFDNLLQFEPSKSKPDRWRGTTGIHEIKDVRQLTIIKSLWEARDELAKEKDVAPGRLIPDRSIIAAVKAEPKSRSELIALRSFSGKASRTYIDLWWGAYSRGNTTEKLVELRPKPTGIPNHRNWPAKFPEANIRLQWARKLLAALSEQMKIPQENLISPEPLRAFCFEPTTAEATAIAQALTVSKVRKWQQELLIPILLECLTKTELPEVEKPTA